MSATSNPISLAFAGNADLRKRILEAINETPQHTRLFEDIADYHLSSLSTNTSTASHETIVQPTKKRKLEDGTAGTIGSQADQPRSVILEAKDISFTLPQRKKLHLNIVQYGTAFNQQTTRFAICGINPATNAIEFEYQLQSFAYVIRVSVPEKAQKQYNFCLLPPQPQNTKDGQSPVEAVLWTVNHGPLKSCQIFSGELEALSTKDTILESALDAVLQHTGNKMVYPTENEFVSVLVESHRKNDKTYHVKAFRGSKDGFLFFLENGIFFGFKKPLAFFPFEDIESVSYTAVLQRTFNLVIVVRAMNDAEEQEIEFSMLDQADFAGIDTYIRTHQLQDASMAEARRAKQFKVNGSKGTMAEGEENDGQTELEKAEQELEDEEDEMEEDYDPGSEGDSEGSGSSDDDYDDDGHVLKSAGKDLVKDELGSEAEDVEITDDDEEAVDEQEGEEDEGEDDPEVEVSVKHHGNTSTIDRDTRNLQHQRQHQHVVPSAMAMHSKQKTLSKPPFSANVPHFDDDDQL